MWNPFKQKNRYTIASPVKGKLIELSQVKDEAFSSKTMGDGFALLPASDTIVSPIDGVIAVCFPTGHAYGITNDNTEMILHIGIDTVALHGKGFHSLVNQGDTIRKGDKIATVDMELLKSMGYDVTTMVIFTNGAIPKIKTYDIEVEEGEEIAAI